ncbi:hypothetical protein SAMN04488542_101399 [Fontibacillus panacisegetis]|uniref:DUF2802 domain-containing protein n=1 Tax=Fontibacillus panacisegetis TaxID=670482 RepID=A0A1G7EZ65_9BACL|nr:hypothetical protein [Fontibacillus panacisegetis]SDE68951.1 hypothetical protein SAMN04488542_101399 [Fontibacillus panacisegetis]
MSFGDPWFYIVLLGLAVVVYAMLIPSRKSTTAPVNNGIGELETTLEQYMSEIEKENDELIDLVAQMKQDFASKQLAQQEQIVELRKRMIEVEQVSRNNTTIGKAVEHIAEAAPAMKTSYAVEEAVIPVSSDVIEQLAVLAADQPHPDHSADLDTKAPESVRDRYPELFDLYEKGKSIDMIAKTIGIQRGEIQLILQLAKREAT